MKRRYFVSALAGGALAAGAGLRSYVKWSHYPEVRAASRSELERTFDVCVIGSGPAGSTVVSELADAGLSVVWLESGVASHEPENARFAEHWDAYRSTGELAYPLPASRVRGYGGTSAVWTGNCPRLQPEDLSDNPYADAGRWPIPYAELEACYAPAELTLSVVGAGGVRPPSPETSRPAEPSARPRNLERLLAPLEVGLGVLPRSHTSSWSTRANTIAARFGWSLSWHREGPVRFGLEHVPLLSQLANVTLLGGLTADRLETGPTGSVESLRTQTLAGQGPTIRADRYVVACGGVESVRLLLLSQESGLRLDAPEWLGACFTEHPYTTYFVPFGEPVFSRTEQLATYRYRERFREQELGGAVLKFYGRRSNPEQLEIAVGIEMEPLAENRLALDPTQRDRAGNPGIALSLRFGERDRASIALGRQLAEEIAGQLGGGPIDEKPGLHWSHHHIGGARMAVAPGLGVVDSDLRVFGTQNLFVASSAVFPTGGIVNPTLSLVALSHRLARTLVAQVERSTRA